MSRISDTRIRTREAASRLVAGGRRPHELTVDLIYAEIRQGSRTTINDELKQWKDEKTKVDALSAQLPPAVADAMLAAWAIAVEHGEKVFDARAAELEAEVTSAQARAEAAGSALATVDEARRAAETKIAVQATQLADLQQQLAGTAEEKHALAGRVVMLEQQLEAQRKQSEAKFDVLRDAHGQELAALRAAMGERDAAFQRELDKATQRLEGVQKHMMQQISDARDGERRADEEAARLRQRTETLLGELGSLRTQCAQYASQVETATRRVSALEEQIRKHEIEREQLLADLATVRGQLRERERHDVTQPGTATTSTGRAKRSR